MDTNATLTVKVDRVKEAAASCPDAKRVLEKLFPEAFAVKFNPGDFVKGYGGEGIIPHEDINETLDKRFGPRGTNVRYISLHTGASHTDPAHAVVKIVKPQFLK